MKVYLVGGAVRDKLLGIPVKEKDWVVVGSTPQQMKDKGYKQVGKDFPVFINPKTGEEYALARTERKSGHGYTGFEFESNPHITLEEDLERRDLTINAIAQDEDGTLIDPFNGQDDIKNKKLRHVSDAFSEDPLRVLRLARFKTYLKEFNIVSETMDKIKEIKDSGELEYLTGERVWLEIYKSNNIAYFYNELLNLGVNGNIIGFRLLNKDISSVISDNFLNNSSNKLHEISSFINLMTDDVDSFCDQLKIPNDYRDLAKMLRQCRDAVSNYEPKENEYDELLELINQLDIRKTERLKNFFECINIKIDKKIFFDSLVDKIKNFKLDEDHRKKSKEDIIKLIKNAHREIAQEHIIRYLNSK
tara:strand:- start:1064 stop:2146 length:1083 start_codon:yes stop_codon:yes gene_type:complete